MRCKRGTWWAVALILSTGLGACQSARAAEVGAGGGGCPVVASARPETALAVNRAVEQGATVGCWPGGGTVITLPAEPVVPPPGGVVELPVIIRPRPGDFDGWVFVFINGRPLRVPEGEGGRAEPDAYVVRSTARTVMPIRFFTEAIGGEVAWAPEEQRVTLHYRGRTVELWVGRHEARVDGRRIAIDQPPFLFMDRTMLPARFLMEAFGAAVAWDAPNSAVWVELPGAACTSPLYCGEPRGRLGP